jgi:hypothetical protein
MAASGVDARKAGPEVAYDLVVDGIQAIRPLLSADLL